MNIPIKIFKTDNSQALLLNTVFQLLAKVVTTGSTLLITYLITQRMGTVGLGEFIATTSYIALFYLLADFGINAVFTKRVGNTETGNKNFLYIFENLLSIRVGLGVLITFLSVAILSFLDYPANIKVAIIIGSGLILTQALFVTANAIFQVKLRYQLSAVAEIVGSLLTLILVFLVLQSGLGIFFIIGSYLLGSIVKVVLSLTFARRLVGGIGIGSDSGLWASFVLSSLPLGFIAIFSQIMANIDKVVIALVPLSPSLGYSNLEAVGVYGLAYKFFDVSLVLPTYLMNAAFPLFVQAVRDDTGKVKIMTKKLAVTLFGGAVLLAIIGYFLAPWVLAIFGKDNDLRGSVQSLRILLLGLPIFYLSALLIWLAVALEKQKQLAVVYGISALFNLASNIYLVPNFGFIASAWITILSELIIVFGAVFLLQEWWRQSD